MSISKLEHALSIAIEEHGFSGVISIRRNSSVIYEMAAGYADRSNGIKNTLETRFGIASGTKFFTALAIGKLIESGRLSFATKLSGCVALHFPRYSEEVTIQQLLTHTSGIPDYYDEEHIADFDNFSVGIPWYELRGPSDYLPVFPDADMKFAPGERFSYSNSGYILLGVAIEELTGMRYQDFVEQAILKPAGMTQSGFFAMNKLPEKTAMGYIEEAGGGWRTNIYNLPIVGASDGGLFSTAQDIAALWDAFWGYNILSQELVDIYTAPYVKAGADDQQTYYGHGIWIYDQDGHNREEYIVGRDAGVSFKSSVDRMSNTQITVLSNTGNGVWPILKIIDSAL